MKRRLFHSFLRPITGPLILALLWATLAAAQVSNSYNEVFDEQGRVRPHYQLALKNYEKLSEQQREEFARRAKKRFKGDNGLSPLPRIIPDGEFSQLKTGVEQRGRALRALLMDHYSGEKSYLTSGILPKAVIDRISRRSLEHDYEGLIRPESITFPYGPDIIRDQTGTWRVIEDNPGFIGGPGDLLLARRVLFDQFPELEKKLSTNNPAEYYEEIVRRARVQADKIQPGSDIVLYSLPPYADHEDPRLQKIFAKYGVVSFENIGDGQLLVRPNGVYLNKQGVTTRVGFVILNTEHDAADPHFPLTFKQSLLRELPDFYADKNAGPWRKKVKAILGNNPEDLDPRDPKLQAAYRLMNKSPVGTWLEQSLATAPKGLMEAIVDGRVATNYTPGVDFIGDKEFYLYVEDFIRFYLKEEPILRNIETIRLRADLFDQILKDKDNWVIKKVDGRGGDAVWVGPKTSMEELQKLLPRIKAEPDKFIAQRYTGLSTFLDSIVDIRVISEVGNSVYVSPVPWGRATRINSSSGKVNLSGKDGFETTVLVLKPQRSCRAAFH